MITLYTTPSLWGLPSISPACMKLETWLRMANIPHQTIRAVDLSKAPKGKIPFVDYQGQFIGDSTLIIDLLKQTEGIDLDRGLTSSERAISLAFRRMVKENTYWGIAYTRYGMEENWQHYREVLATMLVPEHPNHVWEPIVDGLRDRFRAQLYNQGMGRHRAEEIFQLTNADFQALSEFLADKPFFMGNEPTTLDAAVYAHVGNVIQPPFSSPIAAYVSQLPNLCNHYERMTQQFF